MMRALSLVTALVCGPVMGAEIKWPDRRPIGMAFLSELRHVSPKNPDGFLSKEVDTTTADGRTEFRTRLLEYARRTIEVAKATGGQGVIVWDLEGSRQQNMLYVGDPRVLPEYAPAMDAVADDFFRALTDAGLRTGVCIRPTRTFRAGPDQPNPRGGEWGWTLYDEAKDDVVKEIAGRIEYAKKRWGCSLFYMDSNVYKSRTRGSQFIPAEMLRRLHELHPDVLVIPEHPVPDSRAWSAQFGELWTATPGTPVAELEKHPLGFTVISQLHPIDVVETSWPSLVAAVRGGDVLLFRSWYSSHDAEVARNVSREVAWARAKPQQVGTVADGLKDAAPERRFWAARTAGLADGPALRAAAADSDWLVRKEVCVALGRIQDPESIDTLMALVDKDKEMRYFAALALAEYGDAALPAIKKLVAKAGEVRTAAAVSIRRTSGEQAAAYRLELLSSSDVTLQTAAVVGLARFPTSRSGPALLEFLDQTAHPQLKLAAVKALGDMRYEPALASLRLLALVELDNKETQGQIRTAAKRAVESIEKQK